MADTKLAIDSIHQLASSTGTSNWTTFCWLQGEGEGRGRKEGKGEGRGDGCRRVKRREKGMGEYFFIICTFA